MFCIIIVVLFTIIMIIIVVVLVVAVVAVLLLELLLFLFCYNFLAHSYSQRVEQTCKSETESHGEHVEATWPSMCYVWLL